MPGKVRRGGVEGSLLCLSFLDRSSSLFSGTRGGGVGFSELPEPDGELSVYIRSLSLSDSSEIATLCRPRLDGEVLPVKDATRGLWRRASDKYPDFGTSKLGRRKRGSRGLASSKGRDEEEATALDEDGGKAKSVEDVGSDALVEALGIVRGVKMGYKQLDLGERNDLYNWGKVPG